MIAVLLGLVGCGAASPPPGLVVDLSAYHEVPTLEALDERYPGLAGHLQHVAMDESAMPHVRTRAWVLLAATPEGVDVAVDAATGNALPGAVRFKILRQLAASEPTVASEVLADVWCDASKVVRLGARRLAESLAAEGAEVPERHCETPSN
ncbi:MAG: hypothetical protein KTR31_27785 [Myxococcales bacterium]|nr:hypothetical protein [Myxococcales bacterium]